jgi:hypothetical protein
MMLPSPIDALSAQQWSGVIDRLQARHPDKDYDVLKRAMSGNTVPPGALAALVRGAGRRLIKHDDDAVKNLLNERADENARGR